jgi:fucose 4-O-acetylase-like acetyltransferase
MARNNGIDIAKGLGILLVVLGHNWIVSHSPGLPIQLIFSFHMPLFFVLGGVFLNPSTGSREFIRSKADALLKPYFAVLLLLGIYQIGVGVTTPGKYFPGVLYGVGSTIEWAPLWFLPCLFVTLIVARLLANIVARAPRPQVALTVALIALFVIGAWSSTAFVNIDSAVSPALIWCFGPNKLIHGLPFSLDLVPVSTAFLLCGYLLRQHIRNPVFRPLAVLCAAAMFFGLNLAFRYFTDLNLRIYGNGLITPLRALSGIYLVVALAAFIDSRSAALTRLLAYLGRLSLLILIFHGYVQWSLMPKLAAHLSIGDYPRAMLGLLAAVAIPVVIYECARRIPPLAFVLLPAKRPQRL